MLDSIEFLWRDCCCTTVLQTFFNPELLNLIRTLVIGGDAEELEQILAEGVGLVRAGDNMMQEELLVTRDRCHITLMALEDSVLEPLSSVFTQDLMKKYSTFRIALSWLLWQLACLKTF